MSCTGKTRAEDFMTSVTLRLLAILGWAAAALVSQAMTAEIPRPEHPRPDLERADWLNLNGTWEFAETDDETDQSFLGDKPYPDRITVPFCRESKLSGLGRTGFVKNVWYRRQFALPAAWKTNRVILHIGACDWRTTVWVNGERIGEHTGGSVSFGFEITRFLKPGDNTVIVHAFDDTRSGLQALGKQAMTPKSESIFYTRTTGIWQTVWLEGVGETFVSGLRIEPDVQGSRFLVTAEVDGPAPGRTVHVVCSADGKKISESQAPADWRNGRLVVPVDHPHLWQLGDPFLYNFEVEVREGTKVIDRLKSYAGMRSIAIDGHRILINGKPVFQRLVLDQGFYPDGVWTAPSDGALKHDIEMSMSVGFNGARLHQKVFEPRFLYWADKLGYLVWGEFPNYGLNHKDPRTERPVIEEWNAIVARDRNHPAIIGWCPFNETPSDAGTLQNTIVRMTWQLDPNRPVIDTSGYIHSLPEAEVMDAHDYDQNPQSFRRRWQSYFAESGLPARYQATGRRDLPFMVSEFGGIGWNTGEGWGYGNAPKSLEEFYSRLEGLVGALTDNEHMFGYCYTQLTDVEQERNGIFQFDRLPKFDTAKLKAIFGRPAVYEKSTGAKSSTVAIDYEVLVGSARDLGRAGTWRYVVDSPPPDWSQTQFDDSAWNSGQGGFGAKDGWERETHTPWKAQDIWLRQSFEWDGRPFDKALLGIHFDNGTEVFVNGVEIWKSDSGAWNDAYEGMDVTTELRKTLMKGKNVIAAHCHQDSGGQFIDLALLVGRRK
jgi:hypothetical protein